MELHYYFDLKGENENDVIKKMGQKMYKLGLIEKKYIKHMHKRNEITNVYMGNYLAIPHGLDDSDPLIKKSSIVISKLDKKVKFSGKDVWFVIGIAVKRNEQTDILQKIAIKFLEKKVILKLIKKNNEEIKKYFNDI